jgi:hypothetical protein
MSSSDVGFTQNCAQGAHTGKWGRARFVVVSQAAPRDLGALWLPSPSTHEP